MSIMGIAGVHPTNQTVIPAHEDRMISGLRAVTSAVHEYGMKMLVELWHGGSTKPNALGGSPWSCSPIPSPPLGVVPVAMTKAMIDDMVEHFARAAGRVKAGGADGVELHGANGYLIAQFLSRATNIREDEYGGPLENRARFVAEILDAIRTEVGSDFVLGLRLMSNQFTLGGMTPPEAAQIAQILEPKLDFLDVVSGSYYRIDASAGTTEEPMAHQLDDSEVVTRAVSIPTIVTGRIMTMDVANHIVESGASDLVSMVRGLIAEPSIVTKSQQNRTSEIRPCIGTSVCVATTIASNSLSSSFGCAVNPSAGHERERPELGGSETRVGTPRRILVAGGGPAGMEAARSAALRGHEVSLFEWRKQLGGQINLVSKAPHRADFASITNWQADELARIGVKVVLNHAVDPDVVADLKPDVLILATGSKPADEGRQLFRPAVPVPGFHFRNVYSSWDLFGAGRKPEIGTHALVYDDQGEYDALAVADELLARGIKVTFATGFDAFGSRLSVRSATVAPTLRRLAQGRVTLLTHSVLEEIRADSVSLDVGGSRQTLDADSVFFVGSPSPSRELTEYLDEFHGEVHTVGDAAGFHTLMQAIHDGDALGRAV